MILTYDYENQIIRKGDQGRMPCDVGENCCKSLVSQEEQLIESTNN